MNCVDCPNAIWDYEEYFGTNMCQWFVTGCRLGKTEEECEVENDECSD